MIIHCAIHPFIQLTWTKKKSTLYISDVYILCIILQWFILVASICFLHPFIIILHHKKKSKNWELDIHSYIYKSWISILIYDCVTIYIYYICMIWYIESCVLVIFCGGTDCWWCKINKLTYLIGSTGYINQFTWLYSLYESTHVPSHMLEDAIYVRTWIFWLDHIDYIYRRVTNWFLSRLSRILLRFIF